MGVLIVFLVIAFISGEVARFQVFPTAGVILLDVGVGLLALLLMFLLRRRISRLQKLSLTKPVLLFLGVCGLSLILSPYAYQGHFIISSLYLIRFVLYIAVYFLFCLASKRLKSIVPFAMLVAGISLVVLGLIQYLFYPNLRNLYYLGWDDHLYRLFSTFLDPNFAGMFFVLFIIFLFPFIRRSFRNPNKWVRVIYLSAGTLTVVAILLTYSRTAFIMLIIGVALYLILYKMFKLLLISLCGIILLIAVTSNVKVEGLNPFRIASTAARVESSKQALVIVSEYPILGVGFNAYQFALFEKGFREKPSGINHAVGGTDNSFLFVAATTGIIGLMSYGYLIYSLILQAKRRITKKVFLADVALISVITLGVGSIFINGLFYPMMLFWIVLLYGIIEA